MKCGLKKISFSRVFRVKKFQQLQTTEERSLTVTSPSQSNTYEGCLDGGGGGRGFLLFKKITWTTNFWSINFFAVFGWKSWASRKWRKNSYTICKCGQDVSRVGSSSSGSNSAPDGLLFGGRVLNAFTANYRISNGHLKKWKQGLWLLKTTQNTSWYKWPQTREGTTLNASHMCKVQTELNCIAKQTRVA